MPKIVIPKFVKDLFERMLVAAAVAFMSSATLSDASTYRSGGIAAGSAVAQFVVGILTQRYGDPQRASVIK